MEQLLDTQKRFIGLSIVVLVAVVSRLVPHPPNFTAVEAIGIFAGMVASSRVHTAAAVIGVLFLSDVMLALTMRAAYAGYLFSATFWVIYGTVIVTALITREWSKNSSWGGLLLMSVIGAVLFFTTTNAAAWWALDIYPKTVSGLVAAYVAGLPFLKWTVLSTLIYGGFLKWALLRRAPTQAWAV